jgi:hypothetical protein
MARTEEDAVRAIRKGAKKIWPGCERGQIVSIDDPDQLGRVRVRVWALHGDDTVVPDSSLPWADVSEQGGGGYDYGSFDPPPVGSGVWVMFEGGNPDLPVVQGTFRGVPKRDTYNPNIFLVKDNKPNSEKPWKPPDEEVETPKDVFEDIYAGDPHPTRRVWKKSYKGHTIVIEDGDGKEFLQIIDRAGQIIELDCPVAEGYAEGNAAQRGTRNAIKGDQLPHEFMKYKRAAIRIRDLSGQEILLDAKNQEERIVIRGHSVTGSENKIIIKSGKGKESIEIVDSSGDTFKMDPNSDTPIVIRDNSVNAIVFDKAAGGVKVSSAKVSEEESPQKKITIKGKKESEIKGDEVKRVLGNKNTKVVNDFMGGVLGNSNISLGGALKMVLANVAPSGPETTALDILIANATGGGSARLSTLLGNLKFDSVAGNVELSTLAGIASLKTTAGIANVDGTSVKLGSVLTAIQPVLKGTVYTAAEGIFLTALAAFLLALKAYVVGIQPIADAPGTFTTPLLTAIGVFDAAIIKFGFDLATSLSAKVFTE